MVVVNDILASADPNAVLAAATVLLATLIYGECVELRQQAFSLKVSRLLAFLGLIVRTGHPAVYIDIN